MSSSKRIKQETPPSNEDNIENLDDITELINRAEAIIEDNRKRQSHGQRRSAASIWEEAMTALQDASSVIANVELSESSSTAPQSSSGTIHSLVQSFQPAAGACAHADNDDVVFVACLQPPDRHPIIDLSTPDATSNEQYKTRRRRRGGQEQNTAECDTAINDIPNSTAATNAVNDTSSAVNCNDARHSGENSSSLRTQLRLECPICWDTFKKMTSTICGHVFCEKCIKMAIKSTHKCPLCKRKLTNKGIHPVFL